MEILLKLLVSIGIHSMTQAAVNELLNSKRDDLLRQMPDSESRWQKHERYVCI
jgi:hypothetical protein